MINQQIPEANSFFESADTIQTPASQADTPVFYNKPQDVLFTAPFSSEIKGKFGADPITAKWALVFEEQELEAFPITIISKDGQILQYQLGQFVSVDQVAEITVSGQKYTLLPDAWGNPSFYQEAEKEELSRGFSSIQELKTSALNIISTEPSSLLDNGNSIVERRILRAVLEDEAAKEQLGQIQRLYYEKYLSDLKRLLTIKQA